jgi:hypothetical protein
MRNPNDFVSAAEHAPVVRAAREQFIDEMVGRFPRQSVASIEEYADYLIARGYLTNKFYGAYANGIEEHE